MKKKLLFLMTAIALFVPSVMAAELTAGTDAELKNAFATAVNGDTIKLTANIENHEGGSNDLMVKDGKTITLDLNGFSISTNPAWNDATNKPVHRSITVNGGTLNIIGKGTIKHAKHVAVNVWGVENPINATYSALNVGKDVILEGETGISVFQDTNNAYGVEVTFEGTINAIENGITINGYIKHEQAPVITVKGTAKVNATGESGCAIYAAGNGTWYFEDGVEVKGVGSALGIKAGEINVMGGTFTATGASNENPALYNNGINPSGAAVQIETNLNNYYGHARLHIEGGEFISEQGNAILEYGSNTTSAAEEIDIRGGVFTAVEEKEALKLSDSIKTNNNVVNVFGGAFSSSISEEIVNEEAIRISFAAIIDKEVVDMTEVTGVIIVPVGTIFDEETINELKALVGSVEEGYRFEGYYSDGNLTNKMDFTKEITEDTVIYMNFVKVPGEENPKTSDINLALILALLGVSSVGAVLVSRKRTLRANR